MPARWIGYRRGPGSRAGWLTGAVGGVSLPRTSDKPCLRGRSRARSPDPARGRVTAESGDLAQSELIVEPDDLEHPAHYRRWLDDQLQAAVLGEDLRVDQGCDARRTEEGHGREVEH